MSANLPAPLGDFSSSGLNALGGHEGEEAAARPRETITAAQKAAIIIAALGPESAPHILQGASETTIRQFARAMSGLWKISPEVLEETIDEFTRELGADTSVKGGAAEARKVLKQLLDDDSVSRIMDDVNVSGGRTLWEKLSNSSDQALAGFLRHEHPQTATVVLSKMRSEKAARILERLDPDFAQIIVLRLARVPRLDSEVMEVMSEVITRDFLAVIQREQATRRPADVIGSMMNNVSTEARARLLEQLEQEKPALARQVQKAMFTFANVAERVEGRDATVIMKGVEEKTLMVALKYAEQNAPRVVDFFMMNISKRLAQRLQGELAGYPPVKPRDGEAAQVEIVNLIRELAKTNEITLLDLDEEE